MLRRLVGVLAALTLTAGCHGPKSPEELKKAECIKHPEGVALFRGGERPQRPFRVLTEVDATLFVSSASRTRTLQVKACQLGADAVIDVTDEVPRPAWDRTGGGTRTVAVSSPNPTREGRGLAIQYVDDVEAMTAPPTSAAPGTSTGLDSAASIPPPTRPTGPASR